MRLEISLTSIQRKMNGIKYNILYLKTGLILGLRSANERRRYKVTPSLIAWAQTIESALGMSV